MSAFVKWNAAFQALLNRLSTAATNAEADAATATTKAGQASASATAAAGSASTAAGHAQASYDSATEAAQQANTASGHAVTATTKAGQATTAANNAAAALAETETLLATMSIPDGVLLVSPNFATTPKTFPTLPAALAQAEAMNPTSVATVKVVLLRGYIPDGTDLAALAASHIHVHDVRRSVITADLNAAGQSLQVRGGGELPATLAERELFILFAEPQPKLYGGPEGGGTPVLLGGAGGDAGRTLVLYIEYDGGAFSANLVGGGSASGAPGAEATIAGALPDGYEWAREGSAGVVAVGGSSGELVPFVVSKSNTGGALTIQMISGGTDIGTVEVPLVITPAS